MNGAGRPASRGMLSPMTTPPFDALLSTRARYAVPLTTPRQSMSPLFEFGGGYPDPVSFPYEGMIEATAKMMAAEGADLPQVSALRDDEDEAGKHRGRQRLGPGAVAGLQRVRGPGRRDHHRGTHLLGLPQHDPAPRAAHPRRAGG